MADENVTPPTENNNEKPQATTPLVESTQIKIAEAFFRTELGESEPPKVETVPPAPLDETPPKQTEKKPSQSSRFSGMVNFSGEKGRIVTEIIEKGIEEGYWKTKQQFYDKIFDFGINSQLVHAHLNVTDAYIFGVPDNVQTKLFTNGFYENDSQLKLEKC